MAERVLMIGMTGGDVLEVQAFLNAFLLIPRLSTWTEILVPQPASASSAFRCKISSIPTALWDHKREQRYSSCLEVRETSVT